MEKELIKVVADFFKTGEENIKMETGYRNYAQWDSLAHLRLVEEVENKFKIIIPIERVNDINKVADFIKFIDRTYKEVEV